MSNQPVHIPGDADSHSNSMRTRITGYADKLAARLLSVWFCMSGVVTAVNGFVGDSVDGFAH